MEENLITDGCRDALIVWRQSTWKPEGESEDLCWDNPTSCGTSDVGEYRVWETQSSEYVDDDWPRVLIDGHNRYEICQRLGIDFNVVEMEFSSRDEAEDWIDKNQAGRRNATPEQLSLIRGRRYNRAKKRHGGEREASPQNEDSKKTSEVIAEQHGVSKATIERDGKFAEAVEVLGIELEVVSGEIDAPKAAIVEAAKPIIEATKAHAKWEEEAKQTPFAPPPEPRKPTIEDIQKAKAHVSHNSGENEWYTPAEFVESARAVMGSIDCDPASSEVANKTVKAKIFYTKDDDGLSKTWGGCVWMNPPYAQPLIAHFAEAVSAKFESREIDKAIVLVNNATETTWFQRMASVASGVCFPKGRIRFVSPVGVVGAPLQGQAILYFGDCASEFMEEFKKYGGVYGKRV